MESYEIIWKTTLPELEKTVSHISFDTYITSLKPVDIVGSRLILCTSEKFFANTISSKMSDKIKEALSKSNKEITDFTIVVAKDREDYLSQLDNEDEERTQDYGSPVNTKFTFDSFVVGPSNDFLYAAAKAVADQPGEAYNPLFVYGGTGLGKTHMLMAIANELRLKKPSLNVVYSTCEKFTNQLIESISKGKGSGASFRKKYRHCSF